jgi:hypothetical protein
MQMNGPHHTEREPVQHDVYHDAPLRSPWALISIIGVIILFGIFWIVERHNTETKSPQATTTPPPAPSPAAIADIDVTELQAATADIPLFDYSTAF